MSQQPYNGPAAAQSAMHPNQPYPQFFGSPALTGTRATTAGQQILVWLLDGLIFGIPLAILSFLAFLPLLFKIGELSRVKVKRYSARASEAQLNEILVLVFLGIGIVIVLSLIYYFIYWCLIATRGRTPGMSILGLRLVSWDTGQPIGWGQAFLRGIIVVFGSYVTGGIVGLLFWLSPLFDSTTGWAQSWQDKLVKAVMIDTKNGRDPFLQP
ncbi:RDD family protein [Psychromicrobium sp. YIM B11713]|uniref:RDD family protein n=1 Tax=Psychromicrobium sp. YIM B11713 TaxID=3145233 RepID=UPI00374EAC08